MEDIYILINDCIHNLSSSFTFNLLLRLSAISKYSSCLIYQLKIHDHVNQPIYYTSTNQIKKFYNIDTVMISKYYTYNNLDKLTHIKNIRFYDLPLPHCVINNITKMTQLTSCNSVKLHSDKISYFHTNLSKLYIFHHHEKIYDIKDIISFTHLTNINARKLHGCNSVKQFQEFVNLKSLKIYTLNNLSKLSSLRSLESIKISCDTTDFFTIAHPTITSIQIYEGEDFEIQNCFKLMYLKLTNCENCIIDANISCLLTLILEQYNDLYDTLNINFDINECVNLEYLVYSCNVKKFTHLSSRLTKLNSLNLRYDVKVDVDDITANNLTYLCLYYCKGVFDFNKYGNLKQLRLDNVTNINIDKLIQLEYLDLYYSDYENENNITHFIDCVNHRKLTYLSVRNYRIINLTRSNKLNELMSYHIDIIDMIDIWNNDIRYLTNLTYLCLYTKYTSKPELHSTKIFDVSDYENLKYLECNFLLNDLSLLSNVNHLNISYYASYCDILSKLTKLTTLCLSSREEMDKIDIRNLKRLNYCSDRLFMLPEITMIE